MSTPCVSFSREALQLYSLARFSHISRVIRRLCLHRIGFLLFLFHGFPPFLAWDTRLDPAFVVWFHGTVGLELLSLGMEPFRPFHAPADPGGSSLHCFDLDLVFCIQVKPSSLEISTSKQHRRTRRMSRIFGGRAAAKVSFGPTRDGTKRADGWSKD